MEKRARPQKDQALNCPRRYWTEGGSLRNVPVGGGSRKNKRPTPASSSSSPSTPSSTKKFPDLATPQNFPQNSSQTPKIHQGQDLNLAYPPVEDYSTISKFIGLNSFMAMPVSDSSTMYNSTGFPFQDFKPGLSFSLEGFENGYGGDLQGIQEGEGARILFPVEDLKSQQITKNAEFEPNRSQGDSTGYWNGMLGGGSW
uniref:Dof zinc finger protein DOF3.7 n=1 Tax=Cajanus cajan TaxID=3821 RepID=A0A151QN91_CAJCA|nr:Dof zinc finger protein DOF3.7 [Cajanus cajan]